MTQAEQIRLTNKRQALNERIEDVRLAIALADLRTLRLTIENRAAGTRLEEIKFGK